MLAECAVAGKTHAETRRRGKKPTRLLGRTMKVPVAPLCLQCSLKKSIIKASTGDSYKPVRSFPSTSGATSRTYISKHTCLLQLQPKSPVSKSELNRKVRCVSLHVAYSLVVFWFRCLAIPRLRYDLGGTPFYCLGHAPSQQHRQAKESSMPNVCKHTLCSCKDST